MKLPDKFAKGLIKKGKIKSPWLRKLWILAWGDVVYLRRADNIVNIFNTVKTGTKLS